MEKIRFTTKSPRKKRIAKDFLESIPCTEKEDVDRAVVLCLEKLMDVKKAENRFMKVLSQGLATRDASVMLASVQMFVDDISTVLAGRDEHLARTLELKSTTLTARIADRMTGGGFTRIADEGMFHEVEMKRALADNLRELGEAALLECDPKTDAAAELHEALEHRANARGGAELGPSI